MGQSARDALAEVDPEFLLADGFDDAIIGYVERATSPPLACYSKEKCLQVLMRRDGMGQEEAEEFFEFNVIGAWVGDRTPVFLTTTSPWPKGDKD